MEEMRRQRPSFYLRCQIRPEPPRVKCCAKACSGGLKKGSFAWCLFCMKHKSLMCHPFSCRLEACWLPQDIICSVEIKVTLRYSSNIFLLFFSLLINAEIPTIRNYTGRMAASTQTTPYMLGSCRHRLIYFRTCIRFLLAGQSESTRLTL